MISGLYTAASGLIARMEALDATTNNLANANTTGYKAHKPSFESYLKAEQQTPVGAMPMIREAQNTGTRLSSTALDMRAGGVQQTGNPLDVALEGDGFLVVQTPAGVRYTKNGSLSLDSNNRLVTKQGYPVLGEGGPIVLDGTRIEINPAGAISVDGSQVGSLQVVEFKDDLLKEGENLFMAARDTVAEPSPKTRVKQGYIETSNVNVVKEMIALVEEGRAAETYQKVIQAMGDVLGKAVNEVGKV
ncbi:MAG: flagellar basal-body rod protein FlgF [Nitrospirota bacterium]|nr:flagellar basal-body rod protein FlgF [Nitrospirota bacterium]